MTNDDEDRFAWTGTGFDADVEDDDEPEHTIRLRGGTWWCITCDRPYCD